MKLGITGLLPGAIADLDAAAVRRVREMGFTGTALNVVDDPAGISTDTAREIGRICAGEGVEVVEYGQYQTSFVDLDGRVRAKHIATMREAARVASAAACPVVIAGIGSLNPADQWYPHPDNSLPATRERLISALGEAVRVVADQGVVLALECHVATSLNNARVAREVLDAVGSPSLKVHLDPVNWMTFETVFESGKAIALMFSALEHSRISGAHSKGVMVENRLISHLNETYTRAPDDVLDHAALLRGLAAMPGETYLVIEHLAVEQMPGARAHLLAVADQLGLSFIGADA